MKPWLFFSAFLSPLSVVVGYCLGGIGNFYGVVAGFVFLPLLDQLLGADSENAPSVPAGNRFPYRLLLACYAPVHVALVVWGAWAATTLNGAAFIGFALSMGICTGAIAIPAAHELCHQRTRLARFFSKAILLTAAQMYFDIEHLAGHHVYVATPEDPSTARPGESVYHFIPRCLIQTFLSAWCLEAARLRRIAQSPWCFCNRMFVAVALPFIFAASLGLLFGSGAIAYYVLQSAVAILLLQITNYIEHYGMQRLLLPSGRYERVNEHHSWSANRLLSNHINFNLQRHADHHAHPAKSYQTLRAPAEGPMLPAGYGTMILVALIPPLWRHVLEGGAPGIHSQARVGLH
jgi:alkane 1-monooxygenase